MIYTQTHKRNTFRIWRKARPLLTQLDIELTERCNNACIHCLINQPENDAKTQAKEMDTVFVENVLQQAASLGCLTVRFTGGEPLLRNDFSDLYIYARRLGMRVILFTNARLITPELTQLLSLIPAGRPIEVTVYGMHPESYEAVAASHGAFAEFWRGIGLLRKYRIPFIVKQSVLPPNRHEMAEFEAFASTYAHMQRTPIYTMNFELRARRDNPAKNHFIKALRITPDETVTMLARNPTYIKEMREFAGKFMNPPGDKLFNCGAGHAVCVDAYGKVQMCMGLRDPATVFDLHSSPASENDRNEGVLRYALTEFFPWLRETRATNPDFLNRCARCFLKGLCEQCPAKSWQEHGTLDTPVEYLCEVAHAQARYLGLLNLDERSWEIEPETWHMRVARFSKT
jgi:radical SAM protein with 4Fe4S-binding SPASM domain